MMLFSVDESRKSVVKLKGKSGKIISVGCCFPPKFANSGTLESSRRWGKGRGADRAPSEMEGGREQAVATCDTAEGRRAATERDH